MMDLGSNSNIVLNDETLRQQGDQAAEQNTADAEAEVAAQQAAILNDTNFDPSALPATAAGDESGHNG